MSWKCDCEDASKEGEDEETSTNQAGLHLLLLDKTDNYAPSKAEPQSSVKWMYIAWSDDVEKSMEIAGVDRKVGLVK